MAVKLKILLWKNFKLEKRMWKNTLTEILAILLLGVLIIACPSRDFSDFKLTDKELSSLKIYDEETLDNLRVLLKSLEDELFPYCLAYEPDNGLAKQLTEGVSRIIGLEASKHYIPTKCLAKITYDGLTGSKVPQKLHFKIRFPGKFRTFESTALHSNLWLTRCVGSLTIYSDDMFHDMQTDLYHREGFLQIQHAVFMEWSKMLYREQIVKRLAEQLKLPKNEVPEADIQNELNTIDYGVLVRTFRYNIKERLCQPVQTPNLFSIFYYFMYFLPFLNLVWKYSRECEENMLAHHNRYGCSSWKYWFSHCLCSFLHLLLISILVLILTLIDFKTSPNAGEESFTTWFYMIVIFSLTSLEYIISAITIAVLIPSSVIAIYLSILVWLLTYAIFSIVLEYSRKLLTFSMILSLTVFFNNDFAYAMLYLRRHEGDETLTLMLIIFCGVLFKFCVLILLHYLRPGRYKERSQSKCFQSETHQNKYNYKNNDDKFRLENEKSLESGRAFEGVVVTRLQKTKKIFRKAAQNILQKVNMLIHIGEITVVYGHYNSGKTTFVAMLAGWKQPDQGTIEFFNKNIRTDKNAIKMADVSMPNNALYDCLTPFETLIYFINIKSNYDRQEQFNRELQLWMKTVRPLFKKDEEYKKLVGDMEFDHKRLLALCCVLCCNTKIVILDEPTAHMKAKEQRLYWSILQREKEGRVIIITTTSIRETETIGDRVAVLTAGVLKVFGTPMFLKTVVGDGFDLVILKEKESPTEPITNFLKEYVPNIVLHIENSDQLTYRIPADKRPVFQIMLIQLQKQYKQFGIIESRLLTIDLNSVILSMGQTKEEAKIPKTFQALSVDFLPKKKRICQQWGAMFFKKFKHQAPPIIPLLMCLSSIFLITLLMQLLNELRERGKMMETFNLGFDKNSDKKYLSNFNDCKFIGIRKIKLKSAFSRSNEHSYTFDQDSFFCSTEKFETYAKKSKTLKHLYGAFAFEGGEIFTIYVNQHIFHSAPLVLNLAHNYILRKFFDDDVMLTVTQDPIPVPAPYAIGLLDSEIEHLFVPLAIGIVLPLTICSFIISIVSERNSNALFLMCIAGLRIDIYWFVNFLWDWLTFLIYSLFLQIVLALLYFREMRFQDMFLLFFIINIYSIPLLASLYLISMLNQASKYRAYVIACVLHVVTGIFAFVVYWDVMLAQSVYLYVLLLFPTFALLDGVSNAYVISKFLKDCDEVCKSSENCDSDKICNFMSECCEFRAFQWGNSGILRSVVFLLISTAIIVLLMAWVEIHQRETKFVVTPRIKKMFTEVHSDDDSQIVRMRERIAAAEIYTIAKQRLVLDQVERKIPKKSLALSTISFEVDKEMCFAIYGTNCVGKSHLCRQIVGQDSVRFGDIYVRGIPIKYNKNEAWQSLGFSPENVGMLTRFTVIEVLHFYCLLRGVPKGAIHTVVSDITAIFNLDRVISRKVGLLSIASQRKVSIAAAMMATNKVVILDEPTRGLPQWACLEIWTALRYLCACGKTIVITTTNMYDCDAIANQVLMIDETNMLALGSSQLLRTKQIGFFLDVKLRQDGATPEEIVENLRVDVENLNRFMIFMHSESILINQFQNCVKYYIPVENINFNILYGSMERNRERLNIIDYTVSQGTFEEVLRSLADEREKRRS